MMARGVPSPTVMMMMINVENESAGGSPKPTNTVLRAERFKQTLLKHTHTLIIWATVHLICSKAVVGDFIGAGRVHYNFHGVTLMFSLFYF